MLTELTTMDSVLRGIIFTVLLCTMICLYHVKGLDKKDSENLTGTIIGRILAETLLIVPLFFTPETTIIAGIFSLIKNDQYAKIRKLFLPLEKQEIKPNTVIELHPAFKKEIRKYLSHETTFEVTCLAGIGYVLYSYDSGPIRVVLALLYVTLFLPSIFVSLEKRTNALVNTIVRK